MLNNNKNNNKYLLVNGLVLQKWDKMKCAKRIFSKYRKDANTIRVRVLYYIWYSKIFNFCLALSAHVACQFFDQTQNNNNQPYLPYTEVESWDVARGLSVQFAKTFFI